MLDRELAEPAAALLSVAIGMIMVDHVDQAVRPLPDESEKRRARFDQLGRVAEDVTALAAAAEVLLRRGLPNEMK
jgi:hypothetical protein